MLLLQKNNEQYSLLDIVQKVNVSANQNSIFRKPVFRNIELRMLRDHSADLHSQVQEYHDYK